MPTLQVREAGSAGVFSLLASHGVQQLLAAGCTKLVQWRHPLISRADVMIGAVAPAAFGPMTTASASACSALSAVATGASLAAYFSESE